MSRYIVDIDGVYYDLYKDMADFVTIHLAVLPTEIQIYEREVLLAIL